MRAQFQAVQQAFRAKGNDALKASNYCAIVTN